MFKLFNKTKHYNGTGFDLGGVFSNSPDEVNIEDYVRKTVKKDNVNEKLMSKQSFELQLKILYMQVELYKVSHKETDHGEDNYCEMNLHLLSGISSVYVEIYRDGYEKWKKEKPISKRIQDTQDELSPKRLLENTFTIGEIIALANLKEGNLYYKWDLDNDISPIVMNPDFIEIAENRYHIYLPGKIARDLEK